MKVSLTYSELLEAGTVGLMRNVESSKLGRQPAHGLPPDQAWQAHIDGAIAEKALAKALGVYWSGKGFFRGADVADMDVRSTPRHAGCLILHPNDPDDRIFWLITGQMREFVVRGWMLASDGKQSRYWREKKVRTPAYFVPQGQLHSPESFRAAA